MTVRDGRVVGLGPGPDAVPLPPGAVVVPGFVDPHLHLLAAAAAKLSLDLGPERAPDLAALARLVADAARQPARSDGWVRAVGFDEALMDRPGPTGDPLPRAVLDRAAPRVPVVVHHAAGHVVHLNSPAMVALGVDAEREDGTPGVSRRPDGTATGVVAARAPALAGVPALGEPDLVAALAEQAGEHLAAGLVALTDATVTNDAATLALLDRSLSTDGPAVTAMVSVDAATTTAGLRFGTRHGRLTVGHIKIVIEGDDPSDDELDAVLAGARAAEHPVAVHVTDVDGVARLIEVLARHPRPVGSPPDRVEHCSLCLPEQVAALAVCGVAVVTQPSFLARRGAKYATQFGPVEQDWLYRAASLRAVGVTVAASSDAPVVPAVPLESLAAAVTRRLGPGERVGAGEALAMVTSHAAQVGPTPSPGRLVEGGRADLVVLDADPLEVAHEELAGISVLATVVAGRVAYDVIDGSQAG